jgi:AraC-like DNA-binding protein
MNQLRRVLIQEIFPALKKIKKENFIVGGAIHPRKLIKKDLAAPDYIKNKFYNFHLTPEFCFCRKGKCVLHIGASLYQLGAGDFCAIPRNRYHFESYDSPSQEYEVVWFSFHTKQEIHTHAGHYRNNVYKILKGAQQGAQFKVPQELMGRFDRLVESDWPWAKQSLELRACFEIMDQAIRQTRRQGQALAVENKKSLYQSNRLFQAIEFIKKHFAENITREKAAAHIGLSPGHFEALLRRIEGSTFTRFLTNIRLMEAQRMFSNTSLNITEIAARCGYADPYYFSRTFKKYTGLSPRAFRDQY